MTIAKFEGCVFQGGATAYHGLAAQQDKANTPLKQADLASIHYWIRNKDTNVFTKSEIPLVVSDVITDTPDKYGDNMHVQFPHDSFPAGGVSYEVTFRFTASDANNTVTYGEGVIRSEGVKLV